MESDKRPKQKFVYVIASETLSKYHFMLYWSLRSLRESSLVAEIILLTDKKSFSQIKSVTSEILKLVDFVEVVPVPYESSLLNSRYLKIRSLNYVQPPFVFVDTDTLIRENSYKKIPCGVHPIGMAVNHSQKRFVNQIAKSELKILQALNRNPTGPYFNSGVIVANDPDVAALISNRWLKNYKMILGHWGATNDQPALYQTLREANIYANILSDKWNAQILMNPSSSYKAGILHMYGSESKFQKSKITSYHDVLTNTLLWHEKDVHFDILSSFTNVWRERKGFKKLLLFIFVHSTRPSPMLRTLITGRNHFWKQSLKSVIRI